MENQENKQEGNAVVDLLIIVISIAAGCYGIYALFM